jgi:hypothetical protein
MDAARGGSIYPDLFVDWSSGSLLKLLLDAIMVVEPCVFSFASGIKGVSICDDDFDDFSLSIV